MDPAGARRTPTPPRSPRAGSSTGSTPGSGFAPRDGARGAAARQPRRPGRARPREPRARAQPPHARAVRAARRRARACRSSTATACSSRAELDRNLATDFRPDGVHREASTHYHAIALRSFVGARENARRYGVELPAGFDERARPRAAPSLPTAPGPTARSPRCRTPTRGDYSRAARRSTARPRSRRRAPATRSQRASPTAATTCSAAAGTATRGS